jgi:hypothetical protein
MRRRDRNSGHHPRESPVVALTKEARDQMTPDSIIAKLREGNTRFREGRKIPRDFLAEQRATASGQYARGPRTSPSGTLESSSTRQASASVDAAWSRSFHVQSRTLRSACSALAKRSRNSMARTSRASSCALASRLWMNATSVATRRASGSLATALTFDGVRET